MIDFRSVSFSYEKKGEVVLSDISFEIKRGELVAIVGKNGSGKTTLLKHINGLLKPLKGEVWINGEKIVKKKISEMAKIVGLAFQNPNHQLFAETVKKELEFGPKNLEIKTAEREKLVHLIADEFNITHLLDRNPFELSGGERRLVSIASVLTMGQQILVLDEPSFGQDYKQKNRLGNYLKDLAQKGITIVIVSHDIDFILDFVPRIIVLQKGEIIADGKTIDLLRKKELVDHADLEIPVLLNLCGQLSEIIGTVEEDLDEGTLYSLLKGFLFKEEKEV